MAVKAGKLSHRKMCLVTELDYLMSHLTSTCEPAKTGFKIKNKKSGFMVPQVFIVAELPFQKRTMVFDKHHLGSCEWACSACSDNTP